MRKYTLIVVKCGSLERIATHQIEAESIEEARKIGTTKYGKPNHFVGAQSM